ncbi:hypothetical protein Vi05172_g321 [Venturia inaequalis]|nr:hypothetical protein Vi05172_g321 [Venturia inaequalis]
MAKAKPFEGLSNIRQPTLSERAEYEHSLQETVLLLSEQDPDYDARWYRLR